LFGQSFLEQALVCFVAGKLAGFGKGLAHRGDSRVELEDLEQQKFVALSEVEYEFAVG
jgi:hypothetical protein